ncbi:MAG TPA: hypothetical protein VFZ34_24765 [Blastocatellia bacterium]|nr:hypothetical protein [Blastocatellia bacterium]
MRDQVIAEYHALLAADESLSEELFARLKAKMRAYRMLYGERELGVSLRPHFLTRQQYNHLANQSELLASAMDIVTAAALAEPTWLERLGLTPEEQRWALADPGYSLPAINTRVDGFLFGDEIRFVEYNAENPSSLTDQPGLNEILFELRAMHAIAERYRLRQFTPVVSLLQSLVETWREWGGTGAPHIAILDWANLPTEHEFLLLRNFFSGSGLPTIICTPDELEYSNGKLRRGDFVIDLVYKRIVIGEFMACYDETHPLVQAYFNHDVCLINPFRCKIPHKKASFELLTEDECQPWFSAAQRAMMHACIPWTRMVRERKTTYRGKEIDLLEFVRRNREQFILKPNDDYGGRGVLFGQRVSESEWEAALNDALRSDFVVQELIALHTEEFPIFNDREWRLQPMFVDTNPFLFRGKVDGVMVRLADTPIVNVTSGGGETGFFVLEDD